MKSNFVTYISFWNLHADRNPKIIIKEKITFISVHFHLPGPVRYSVS